MKKENSFLYASKMIFGTIVGLFGMFLVSVIFVCFMTIYADWAGKGHYTPDRDLPDTTGYSSFGGW
jgi:predicted PurR-regulated permease PerM